VDLFMAARHAIIVDAVQAGRAAGEVLVFRPEELAPADTQPLSSLHGVGILDVWKLAAALGHQTPTTIVGIQVASVEPGESLSPPVAAAVPRAVAAVRVAVGAALQAL
jgi:hydrogenase maturation protease